MRNGIFVAMMFLASLIFVFPKTVQAQDAHLPRLLRRDVPCGNGTCDQFRMGDSTQITYLWLLANRSLLREQDLGANRGVRLSDIVGNAPFNDRRRENQTLPPLLAERDASGQPITRERVVTIEQLLEVNARTGQHAFAAHCTFPSGYDPYPRFGARNGVVVTLANIAENLPNGCEYRGGISMINGQWVYLPHAGGLTIPQQFDNLVEERRHTLNENNGHGVIPVAQILADRRQVSTWRAQPDVVFTPAQNQAFDEVVDTALERLPSNQPLPVQGGQQHQTSVAQTQQDRHNAQVVACLTADHINTPACATTRTQMAALFQSDGSDLQQDSHTQSSPVRVRYWHWIVLAVLITLAVIAGALFLLNWYYGFTRKYRELRQFKAAHEPLLKVVARNFFGSTPEEIKAQVEALFSTYTQGMNTQVAKSTEQTASLLHLTPSALAVLIEARKKAQDELRQYDAVWTATEEPSHRYGGLNPQTFSQALADALKPPPAPVMQAAPPANNAEVEALQQQLEACHNELAQRDGALLGMRFKHGELFAQLTQAKTALRDADAQYTDFSVKVNVYQQQLTQLLGGLLVGLQVRNDRDLALLGSREAKLMQDCFNREYAQLYAAALAILNSYRLHLKDLQTINQLVDAPASFSETDPRVEVVVAWFEAVLQTAQNQPSVALDTAIQAGSLNPNPPNPPVQVAAPAAPVVSGEKGRDDSWGLEDGPARVTRKTEHAFGAPPSTDDAQGSGPVIQIPKDRGAPVFVDKDGHEDTQPFLRVPDEVRATAVDHAKVNGKKGNGLNGHDAHAKPPPDGPAPDAEMPRKRRPAKATHTPSNS